MRVLLSISLLFLLLCFTSASENEAFEFPKDTRPETPKYFDDYGHINTHYVQRVSNTAFKPPTASVLSNLFKSYSLTMRDLGIPTWLAQGTLLSWYWNKKVFPWETDIDMHIGLIELKFLAMNYNMTVYQFRFPDTPEGEISEYLLDINPHFPERIVGRHDNNRIDARWIDMSNSAYIDITALHLLDTHAREKGKPLLWQTKDGHIYADNHVYPLQSTIFEGLETLVPKEPEKLTAKAYGEDALTQDLFRGYKFMESERQWIAVRPDQAG